MSNLPRLKSLQLTNKYVFVRVDYNVPLEDGKVADDTRLRAHLPTIEHLLKYNARVILGSHLGRPGGQRKPGFSLEPVVVPLSKLLKRDVQFLPDCIGPEVERRLDVIGPGAVVLLENLRFHPEEEKNDKEFGAKLAALGEIYVNDAFSAAHRAHASVDAAVRTARAKAAGLLLAADVDYLEKALDSPERPLTAIVGGAKISTKIDVIKALTAKVDTLIVGGAMANTLLLAQGKKVGRSLVERDHLETAKKVLASAKQADCELLLPEDVVVAPSPDEGEKARTVSVNEIPDDMAAFDVGEKSRQRFATAIAKSKTVLWNGPLGLFEKEPFDKGTIAVAEAVAEAPGLKVAGGGDTLAALNKTEAAARFDHLCTAGGAFLEWIEGKKLPGIDALES